jgi:hypothetical protein
MRRRRRLRRVRREREVRDEFFCFVGEAHEVEELFGAGSSGGGVEAVHAADEAEVLGCGEAAEESESFGDYSDLAFDFNWVGGGVEAEDLDAAGGWGEESGEHFDCGGFSCAVGAEKTEELTGSDGEIDVLNGSKLAETAGEVRGDNSGDHLGEGYLMCWLGYGKKVGKVGLSTSQNV